MKASRCAAVLVLGLATASAQLASVDIHVVLKRADMTQPEREGHRSTSEEQWNYDMTVESKLFQPLTGTDNVELKKASLSGHRHYIKGGHIKAQDTIVGVWVRVFQGEQMTGEYAAPSTLTQEQWQ